MREKVRERVQECPVKLVYDGPIEGTRYRAIVLEIPEEAIKEKIPEALEMLNEYTEAVWECPYKEFCRRAYDEGEDLPFVGTERDAAVAILASEFLRKYLGYPRLDLSVVEESGYGLPEFMMYYNEDARSVCGKWMWCCGAHGCPEMDVSGLMGSIKEVEKTYEFMYKWFKKLPRNHDTHYVVCVFESEL